MLFQVESSPEADALVHQVARLILAIRLSCTPTPILKGGATGNARHRASSRQVRQSFVCVKSPRESDPAADP